MTSKVIVTLHGKPDPDRLKAAVEKYCRRMLFEGGVKDEKKIFETESTKKSRSIDNVPIIIIRHN